MVRCINIRTLLSHYVNEILLGVNLVANQNCLTSFDADLQCLILKTIFCRSDINSCHPQPDITSTCFVIYFYFNEGFAVYQDGSKILLKPYYMSSCCRLRGTHSVDKCMPMSAFRGNNTSRFQDTLACTFGLQLLCN